MQLPFQYLTKENLKFDRIIVFSDDQCNMGDGETIQSHMDIYRRTVSPNCWLHACDLQGYGTTQFIGSRTNFITGWSEKILEFINLSEQGVDTLRKRIENYQY